MKKLVISLSVILIITVISAIFQSTQSFDTALVQGRRFFEKGDLDRALPFLEKAFNKRPTHRLSRVMLLETTLNLGLKDERKKILEVAHKNDLEDFNLTRELADEYYSHSDYAGAETLYREILEKQHDEDIARKLTEVMAWQKKYTEVIPLLKDIFKQNPEDKKTTELLGDVLSWDRQYDEAIETYKILLSSDFRTHAVALKLAEVLRYSGRDDEAIVIYKKYFAE